MHQLKSEDYRNRSGFNLVEAAIVLGVIGLVIGGIWVTAAALTERNRQNQYYLGLMASIDFFYTSYVSSGRQVPAGVAFWNDLLALSVPMDGFTRTTDPTGFTGPWGSSSTFSVYTLSFGANIMAQVLSTIPKSSCLNIFRRFSAAQLSQKKSSRMTAGSVTLTIQEIEAGLTDTQISNFCGASANVSIVIFFEGL